MQPISLEVNSFSPFQLNKDDSAFISLLKIISTPITVYQMRYLKPKKLDEVEGNLAEAIMEVIRK